MSIVVHGYNELGEIRATIDGIAYIIPDDDSNPERRLVADWEAEGNTIGDYVAPPKYLNAAAANAAMVAWLDGFTAAVTGPIPIDERLSWDAKEAAARACIAETADVAQTALIEEEAAVAEEDPADLAALIITRADTFRAVIAKLAGLRRKTMAAIDAVSEPSDYETVLLAAKAELEAIATALGMTAPEE